MSLCLPQGQHRVSVAQTPKERHGKRNQAAPATSRTIDVVVHFVVVMGDSFAAGEGAPERQYTGKNQTSWARALGNNNNNLIAVSNTAKRLHAAHHTANLPTGKCDPALLALSSTERRRLNQFDHIRSHRSSYTHGSQLALELEGKSDKSSVTYVNLAQTGATVQKGLIGNYGGSGEAWREANLPGSYGTNGTMCPQTEMLKAISGGRNADDIFLSVGGNDVGFALAITALYIAHDGDTTGYDHTDAGPCRGAVRTACSMIKAVQNGDWEWFQNLIEFGSIKGGEGLEGLIGLSDQYTRAHNALSAALGDLYQPSNLTLIAPPYFGRRTPLEDPAEVDLVFSGGADPGYENVSAGEIIDTDGNPVETSYCYLRTNHRGVTDLHIIPKEFEVADYEVYRPLVEKMRQAAQHYGWNFVTQPAAEVAPLGICQPSPYGKYGNPGFSPGHPVPQAKGTVRGYRTTGDSMTYQHGVRGDTPTTKGQFHPNEFGYALTKKLISPKASTLAHALYALTDRNDTMSEASQNTALAINRSHRVAAPSGTDVDLYRIEVPAFHQVTVELKSTAANPGATSDIYASCGVLSVYDAAGRVHASSAPILNADAENAEARLEGARPNGSQISANRCIGNVSRTNRRPGLIDLEGVTQSATTYMSRTGFNNGCRAQSYYVAVSGSENVFFDPVIGSTDEVGAGSAKADQLQLAISARPVKGAAAQAECPAPQLLEGFNRSGMRTVTPEHQQFKRVTPIPGAARLKRANELAAQKREEDDQ